MCIRCDRVRKLSNLHMNDSILFALKGFLQQMLNYVDSVSSMVIQDVINKLNLGAPLVVPPSFGAALNLLETSYEPPTKKQKLH